VIPLTHFETFTVFIFFSVNVPKI